MQAAPPTQPPSNPSADARARLERLAGYLRQDPNNHALLADAMAQALRCQAWERAAFYLRHAQSLSGDDVAWQVRESDFWLAQGHHAQAREVLQRLQDVPALPFPVRDIVRHNLALIEMQQGRYREALALLAPRMEALATPGGEAAAADGALHRLWLRALHHDGQLDRAVAWARALDQAGRLPPEAAGIASLAAVDAGEMTAAQVWAGAALDGPVPAVSLEALVARASLALAVPDAAAAVHWADAALQRQPGDGRALSARGFAAMVAQDLAAARGHFEQALAVMGRHIGTWHGLGWAQLLARDLAAARRSFEQALALDRNFAESHGGLAVVAVLGQDTEAAREHIARADRLDRANVSGRYAQALLDGEATDPQAVQRLARRLLSVRA